MIEDSLCHIWGTEGDLHFDLADVTLMRITSEGDGQVTVNLYFDSGQTAAFGTTQAEGEDLVKAHSNRRSVR